MHNTACYVCVMYLDTWHTPLKHIKIKVFEEHLWNQRKLTYTQTYGPSRPDLSKQPVGHDSLKV